MDNSKIDILGTKVSLIRKNEVVFEIERQLKKKKQIFIATPNPEHIIQAYENKDFQKIINRADIAVIDGIGLVKAVNRKLKKGKIDFRAERITGVDLINDLVLVCVKKNWKLGLLGGSEEYGEKAARKLAEKYGGLNVKYIGKHEDVLNRSEKEDKEIIQKIRDCDIDVLLVAYGAPKQELLISEYIRLLPKVKIFMGVGGAFDFIGGKLKRAPKWVQDIGLEWLFRLIQEPWRWKRQIRLIKFIRLSYFK